MESGSFFAPYWNKKEYMSKNLAHFKFYLTYIRPVDYANLSRMAN